MAKSTLATRVGDEDGQQRREAGRQVRGLGVAAGEVADQDEDERAQAEGLHERDRREHPGEEAEHGAGLRALDQRHADDDDEGEVGVGAEQPQVRRHGRLQQHGDQQDHGEPGDLRPRGQGALVVLRRGPGRASSVTTMTMSSLRKSTNGLIGDRLVQLDLLRAHTLHLADGDAAHEDRAVPARTSRRTDPP